MVLTGWDPGIGDMGLRKGMFHFSVDTDMIKGYDGFWGKEIGRFYGKVEVALAGLVWPLANMGKSTQNQGIGFRWHLFTKSGKGSIESGFSGIRIWRFNVEWGFCGSQNIFSDLITSKIRFSFRSGSFGDSLSGKTKEILGSYINEEGMGSLNISFKYYSSFLHIDNKGHISLWLTMTQSQLLGSSGPSGEKRNGEGMRKRLKITVAHFDNTALVKSCSKVLLGRCMNPVKQQMQALLTNMPKIWNLVGYVTGRDLGLGMFQFEFDKEEDIEGVLKLQPYHFDYWMIAIAKWQPKRTPNFPAEIPFWVRVLGVSKEFRTAETFGSIGDAIGKTVEVDLEQMRVLVVIDAFTELCFETSIDFKGGEFYDGEEVAISLRYEKLFGYCTLCGSLCHEEAKCHLAKGQPTKRIEEKKEVQYGNGGWHEGGTHDDRARSYKGVVLKGTGNQQNREREGKEYYGKGKGKMYEEPESRWVRVTDRSNKKHPVSGGFNGGERRLPRSAPSREGIQSGGHVNSTGTGNSQQEQRRPLDEQQEEGEIMDTMDDQGVAPSLEFQKQLAETQAAGSRVVSNLVDMEKGLQQLQGLRKEQSEGEDKEAMEWEVIRASCRAEGFDVDNADDLPELTEEEEAALNQELEEHVVIQENMEESEIVDRKEQAGEEGTKKQTTKKRLFKAPPSGAASNKLRVASAITSPRRKTQAKTSTRNGESRNHQEGKGSSHPTSSHPLP